MHDYCATNGIKKHTVHALFHAGEDEVVEGSGADIARMGPF